MVYIPQEQIMTRLKRYKALNQNRLQRALSLMTPEARAALELVPLLLHYNHICLPGFRPGAVPQGIDLFTPNTTQQNYLKTMLDPQAPPLVESPTHTHAILGLYAMGSTSSLGQSYNSDIDIWVCVKAHIPPLSMRLLQDKCRFITTYVKAQGVELNLFVTPEDRFTNFQPDSLDDENCGSAQNLFLLDEFYRSSIRLCGRYIIWYLISTKEEQSAYQDYVSFLMQGKSNIPAFVKAKQQHELALSSQPERLLEHAPQQHEQALVQTHPAIMHQQPAMPLHQSALQMQQPDTVLLPAHSNQPKPCCPLLMSHDVPYIKFMELSDAGTQWSTTTAGDYSFYGATAAYPLAEVNTLSQTRGSTANTPSHSILLTSTALANDVTNSTTVITALPQQPTASSLSHALDYPEFAGDELEATKLAAGLATELTTGLVSPELTPGLATGLDAAVTTDALERVTTVHPNLSPEHKHPHSSSPVQAQSENSIASPLINIGSIAISTNLHSSQPNAQPGSPLSSPLDSPLDSTLENNTALDADNGANAANNKARRLNVVQVARSLMQNTSFKLALPRMFPSTSINNWNPQNQFTDSRTASRHTLVLSPHDFLITNAFTGGTATYTSAIPRPHAEEPQSKVKIKPQAHIDSTVPLAPLEVPGQTTPTNVAQATNAASAAIADSAATADLAEAMTAPEAVASAEAVTSATTAAQSASDSASALTELNMATAGQMPAPLTIAPHVDTHGVQTYANPGAGYSLVDRHQPKLTHLAHLAPLTELSPAAQLQEQAELDMQLLRAHESLLAHNEITLNAAYFSPSAFALRPGKGEGYPLVSTMGIATLSLSTGAVPLNTDDQSTSTAARAVSDNSSASDAIALSSTQTASDSGFLAESGAAAAANADGARTGSAAAAATAAKAAAAEASAAVLPPNHVGVAPRANKLFKAQQVFGARQGDELFIAADDEEENELPNHEESSSTAALLRPHQTITETTAKALPSDTVSALSPSVSSLASTLPASRAASHNGVASHNGATIPPSNALSPQDHASMDMLTGSTMLPPSPYQLDEVFLTDDNYEQRLHQAHQHALSPERATPLMAHSPRHDVTRIAPINSESLARPAVATESLEEAALVLTPDKAQAHAAVVAALTSQSSTRTGKASLHALGKQKAAKAQAAAALAHAAYGAPAASGASAASGATAASGAHASSTTGTSALLPNHAASRLLSQKAASLPDVLAPNATAIPGAEALGLTVQATAALGTAAPDRTYLDSAVLGTAVPTAALAQPAKTSLTAAPATTTNTSYSASWSYPYNTIELSTSLNDGTMPTSSYALSSPAFLVNSATSLARIAAISPSWTNASYSSHTLGTANTSGTPHPLSVANTINTTVNPDTSSPSASASPQARSRQSTNTPAHLTESTYTQAQKREYAHAAKLASTISANRIIPNSKESPTYSRDPGLNLTAVGKTKEASGAAKPREVAEYAWTDSQAGSIHYGYNSGSGTPGISGIVDKANTTLANTARANTVGIASTGVASTAMANIASTEPNYPEWAFGSILTPDECEAAAIQDQWCEGVAPLTPDEWFDFGSVVKSSPTEYFGSGLWLLYKAIDSPFKVVLKILLMEAYSSDYPYSLLLSSELKDYMLSHDGYSLDLDSYYLMYLKVSHYLQNKQHDRRLELMRKCFYLKIYLGLTTRKAYHRHDHMFKKTLLKKFSQRWGWSRDFVHELEQVATWKMEAVRQFNMEVYNTLIESYQALLRFSVRHGIEYAITSDDAGILSRKLYAAFDRYPGKITLMSSSFSANLEERHLTFIHPSKNSLCRKGWHLYTAAPHDFNLLNSKVAYIGSRLCEVVTWACFNGILTARTASYVVGSTSAVTSLKIKQLRSDITRILTPKMGRVSEQSLQRARQMRAALIVLNLEEDETSNLRRQMLEQDYGSTLCWGRQRLCLVGSIDLVLVNSWGELRMVSFPNGEDGVVELLATLLRIVLNSIDEPEQAIQLLNLVEVCSFASSYQDLIKYDLEATMRQVFNCLDSSNSSEYSFEVGRNTYIAKAQGERGVMINKRSSFGSSEFDISVLSRYGMRPEYALQVPPVVDRYATAGIMQYFFSPLEHGHWDIYIINERNEVSIFSDYQGSRTALVNAITRFYTSQEQEQLFNTARFNLPQYFVLDESLRTIHPFTIKNSSPSSPEVSPTALEFSLTSPEVSPTAPEVSLTSPEVTALSTAAPTS